MAAIAAARLVPLAVSLLLCRAQQQDAAAAEEPDSCAADGSGCKATDNAPHDAPSMLQSRVSRANLTSKATGTCIDESETCGYNGNAWCAQNTQACCCGSSYCSPEQGNVAGIITMVCYSPNVCIFPTTNPAESICGSKGQQQVPCCAGSVCKESKYTNTAGGTIMSCVKLTPVPTPSPTPPPQCVAWNQQCDYDNKCCTGLQCTWANFDPPKTVCLSPSDQSAPAGQCVGWNKDCNYYNKCCKGYTCTWANFNPKKTVCL